MASAASPCEKTFSALPSCSIVLPSEICSNRSARYGSATALERCVFGALFAFSALLPLVRIFISLKCLEIGATTLCNCAQINSLLRRSLVPRRESEEKEEPPMLWTISLILVVLWALGMVSSYRMGWVYSPPAHARGHNCVVSVDQRVAESHERLRPQRVACRHQVLTLKSGCWGGGIFQPFLRSPN